MEAFADLPDALVRDLLAVAAPVAESVSNGISLLRGAQEHLIEQARRSELICRKADLDVSREPSVAGIDGSYQVHRLTALDLCAAAAVAVEGTSKEAARHWPEPRHEMWVDSLPHAIETTSALRALMVSMEMSLAVKAPHDLVLLDGSFSSLLIYLNQGLSKVDSCAEGLRDGLRSAWMNGGLSNLKELIGSDRTAALPKFTSRNELLRDEMLSPPIRIDGKSLATLILAPGEYTRPLSLVDENTPASMQVDHLPEDYCSKDEMKVLLTLYRGIKVLYFRPYGWVPALRIEVPGPIAASKTRLSLALEGVMRQFFSPAVFEPYPLFLADRMVKSLGAGVAVIEQAVAQQVAASSTDVENTILFLQNYRTEGGRGGV